MREHLGLFRGKRIDTGEWVEGFYCEIANSQSGLQEHFILTIKSDGRADASHKVDPTTIGECTSLKDKNGKLIFEGDIIAIRFESDYEPPSAPDVWYEYAKIIWQDEYLGWYAAFEGGDEISLWEHDNCDDIVVVCTVHDNPELLKGGENE